MPAELVDEIRWLHIVGGWVQRLTRNAQGLAVNRLATDVCRSSLKDARMLRRTMGNASVH